MRAVATGAEADPGLGSPACPRCVRWADGELLDGAIDLWPLPVQALARLWNEVMKHASCGVLREFHNRRRARSM